MSNILLSQKILLAHLCVGASLGFGIAPQSSAAPQQNAGSAAKKAAAATQVIFQPPRQATAPQKTTGGATRNGGACPEDEVPAISGLKLVLPPTQDGLTIAQRPTFTVYLPKTSAQHVLFSLQDHEGNQHYQAILPVPQPSGVFSARLPADTPALEVDRAYRWSVVLVCGQKVRPDSPIAMGWVKRVNPTPDLMTRLKNASPLEAAAAYGDSGIWFDTISTLVESLRSQPNDTTIQTAWQTLLQANGLSAIASVRVSSQQ